jgi:hypothetical protein
MKKRDDRTVISFFYNFLKKIKKMMQRFKYYLHLCIRFRF